MTELERQALDIALTATLKAEFRALMLERRCREWNVCASLLFVALVVVVFVALLLGWMLFSISRGGH